MTPQRPQYGFTMVELMITIVVLALVAVFAVPGFQDYIVQNRVKTASQTLLTSLLYARSEAIKRNADVYVYPEDEDAWEEGWAVTFEEDNDDCHADQANCLRVQQALAGISVGTNADAVVYGRDGRISSASSVSFAVCDSSGSAAVRKRQVSIDLTGRPHIDYDGDCSS